MTKTKSPASAKAADPAILAKVREMALPFKGREDMLIEVIKKAQDAVGHSSISKDVAAVIGEAMDIPLSKIFGVASFYSVISTEQRGKYVIRMCRSSPCHVRGSAEVMKAMSEELGIEFGETTPDGLFTLETCECLGICSDSPSMMINDDIYSKLTPKNAVGIIRGYKQ